MFIDARGHHWSDETMARVAKGRSERMLKWMNEPARKKAVSKLFRKLWRTKQYRERQTASIRARWDAMTPEQKAEDPSLLALRRWWGRLTKAERREFTKGSISKALATRTPGKRSRDTKAWWAGASQEERAAWVEAVRQGHAKTPKWKRKRSAKAASKRLKDRWASLSSEDRAEYIGRVLAYHKTATKEERASYTAAARAAYPVELNRADSKRWWAGLSEEERSEQIRKRALGSSAGNNVRPNKLETAVQTYLDAHFPGEWKYNKGDFVIAGKVPDFVNVNGCKALLEIFGDHWHRGENPANRKRIFKKVGYACAVVWESEFRKDPDIVAKRLRALQVGQRNLSLSATPYYFPKAR